MAELRFGGRFTVGFDFTFFAVIAIFLFFDNSGYGIFSILACFFHEAGHILIMLAEKKPPDGLCFYGGGIKITSVYSHSLLTLAAGSGLNFILFGAFYFTSDGSNIFPLIFAAANLMIGLFNLLPVAYLDGKRIAEIVTGKLLPPEKCLAVLDAAEKITFLLIILLVCFLILSDKINFTLIILLVYIYLCDRIK